MMRSAPLLRLFAVPATLVVLASCGSDSSGPLPAQNPTMVLTVTPSGTTMYAGDSLIIILDASDSTAARKIRLIRTSVSVNGALTYDDNVSADSAYSVHRIVSLRIPDGPLASSSLTYSVAVVPTSGATIEANSFIITVLDTVSARRVMQANPATSH
jgi:hypothetical protein